MVLTRWCLRTRIAGLMSSLRTVKSNIGRKRRAIIYGAWRNFLQQGITDADYPLDWEFVSMSD